MKSFLLLVAIFAFNFFAFSQVPQSEKDALTAFYNSTNGSGWNVSTNWLSTEPVSTWQGLTVANIDGADHVTEIFFQNNNMTGTLPADIQDLPYLTSIDIHSCALTGSIPAEIGNLSNLTTLVLYSNEMSGSLPAELGNLTNLTAIIVDYNNFSGSIPEGIGNASALTRFHIRHNDFSGALPASFNNLTNLEELYLSFNQLSGELPLLDNLNNLYEAVINSNDFTGNVDFSANNQLYSVSVSSTQISSMNLKNGNNTNMDLGASSCPNLTCIVVDDVAWSEANWTDIDPQTSFVATESECGTTLIESVDNQMDIYPNPTRNFININHDKVDKVEIYSAFGKLIDTKYNTKRIDISNFPVGVYIIHIALKNSDIRVEKIIKK